MEDDYKVVMARCTTYGRKPRTPYEVLVQARALLAEEGRFYKGDLFKDGDPKVVYENGSLCGNWGVCSLGAMGLVSGDMPLAVSKETYFLYDGKEEFAEYYWDIQDYFINENQAVREAVEFLADAIYPDRSWEDAANIVVKYNDYKFRQRRHVLAAFDKAIAASKGKRWGYDDE